MPFFFLFFWKQTIFLFWNERMDAPLCMRMYFEIWGPWVLIWWFSGQGSYCVFFGLEISTAPHRSSLHQGRFGSLAVILPHCLSQIWRTQVCAQVTQCWSQTFCILPHPGIPCTRVHQECKYTCWTRIHVFLLNQHTCTVAPCEPNGPFGLVSLHSFDKNDTRRNMLYIISDICI